MECKNCKKDIPEGASSCPHCGSGAEGGEKTPQRRAIWFCRAAAIVAFIIAAITTLAAILQFRNYNVAELLDAALVFFLGWGVFKYYSRFYSVFLFLYFLFTKLFEAFQIFNLKNMDKTQYTAFVTSFTIVGIVFLIFLALGVVGSFMYHKQIHTKINKKNAVIKTLMSIVYGIVTFIILALFTALLPNISVPVKTLIIFLPAMLMTFLSFVGVLPISKNYPMARANEKSSTPSNRPEPK